MEERSLFELVKPSIGYLIVVYISLVSGQSLLLHSISYFPSEYNIIFFSFVIPFYLHRVILYEVKPNDEKLGRLRDGIQIPVFLSIIVGFMTFISLYNSDKSVSIIKLIFVFVSLLPFYVQTFLAHSKYKENKKEEYFNFSFYIFFPALVTIIVPFFVGWTNFEEINSLVIIVSLLLLYFFIFKFTNSNYIHYFAILSYIALLLIVSFFSYSDFTKINLQFFQLLVFSITITLLMGITESWWFVKDKDNYHNYDEETMSRYLNGTNSATAFFPFAMVMGFLFPITNSNYIFLILYSLILFYFWNKYEDKIEPKRWRVIRFGLGLFVPILGVLSIDSTAPILIDIMNFSKITQINSIYTVVVFLSGLVSVLGISSNKISLSKMMKIAIYSSSIFIVIVLLLELILPKTPQLITRIFTIKLVYSLIFIFPLIAFFIKLLISEINESNKSNKHSDKNKPSNTIKYIKALTITSRPITSFTAFLYSFFTFLFLGKVAFFNSFILAIPIFLLTSIGFCFNDLYDINKDIKGKNNKAIVTGKTSPFHVIIISIFYFVLLIIALVLLGNTRINLISLIILMGVIFYSPFAKYYSPFKGLYTALLSISPIIYATYSYSIKFSLWLFISLFLYIMGREIIFDIFDKDVDRKSNYKTIPILFGVHLSKTISIFLMTVAVLLLLLNTNLNSLNIIFSISLIAFHLLSLHSVFKLDEISFNKLTLLAIINSLILCFN